MDDVSGLARRDGHVERIEHEPGLRLVAERPADDPARPGIEGRGIEGAIGSSPMASGEEEATRRGRDERDVGPRRPVGPIGGEVAPDEIPGRGSLPGREWSWRRPFSCG
jgi:hypothetical protein